jgi:hypothetical protein
MSAYLPEKDNVNKPEIIDSMNQNTAIIFEESQNNGSTFRTQEDTSAETQFYNIGICY